MYLVSPYYLGDLLVNFKFDKEVEISRILSFYKCCKNVSSQRKAAAIVFVTRKSTQNKDSYNKLSSFAVYLTLNNPGVGPATSRTWTSVLCCPLS